MAAQFDFNMKTKNFITAAKKAGFHVTKEVTCADRLKIHISHPLLKDARIAQTPTHGSINGHLIRYVKQCQKQLRQLEKDTTAPPTAPAPSKTPDYAIPASPDAPAMAEEGKKMDDARHAEEATEALVLWLDDRVKEGLSQFPLSSLNNNAQRKYSLPTSDLIAVGLGTLVKKNILGTGHYEKNGKKYKAYRINPALLNGVNVVDAFTGSNWKSLKPAPAFDAKLPLKEAGAPRPKSQPQPKPQAARAAPAAAPSPAQSAPTDDFKHALVQDIMQDQSMVMTLVDMYITGEQYQKLAELLIAATDVVWCERVLRRVAEIAPRVV